MTLTMAKPTGQPQETDTLLRNAIKLQRPRLRFFTSCGNYYGQPSDGPPSTQTTLLRAEV